MSIGDSLYHVKAFSETGVEIGIFDIDFLNRVTFRPYSNMNASYAVRSEGFPVSSWQYQLWMRDNLSLDGGGDSFFAHAGGTAYRSAQLEAIRENPCLPTWMWKGIVLVRDSRGSLRAVDKGTYDRCMARRSDR